LWLKASDYPGTWWQVRTPLSAGLDSITVPPLVPGCVLKVLQEGNQPAVFIGVAWTNVAGYWIIKLWSGVMTQGIAQDALEPRILCGHLAAVYLGLGLGYC